MPTEVRLSVNAGELSDNLDGREDLSKFRNGCDILENARVLRTGGATRRAGTKYVGGVVNNTRKSRLKGFRFDAGQGYILEFSHLKMRVIQNGVIDPTEYVTPWNEDRIFELQFAQRIDRIVVTHPEIQVYNIVRYVDGTWAIEEFPWQGRIWEEFPQANGIIVTPGAVTGSTTITASDDLFAFSGFDGLNVGDRLKLNYTIGESTNEYYFWDVNPTRLNFSANTTSYSPGQVVYYDIGTTRNWWLTILAYDHNPTPTGDYVTGEFNPQYYSDNGGFFEQLVPIVPETTVNAGWVFETFGTWTGVMLVQRSYNGGVSWSTIKTISSDNNRNERVTETETEETLIRVVVTESSALFNPRVEFTTLSYEESGVAIVTSVTSRTLANVTVEDDFPLTDPTTSWQEEAFSPRNGYPAAVAFHQGRLCFGGTNRRPQTLWMSRSQQPFDFTFGTLDTDGLSLTTDANGYEQITSIVSHLSLVILTTNGVWALSSPDGNAVTPSTYRLNPQIQLGAEPGFQATPVQNNVLFLQQHGRKVQELTGGSVEYGGYLSADLTQLANHITRGGVTQMESGQLPDSSLFLVTGGEVAVLTYERQQNVVGWARWVFDGTVESVATTSGVGEDDDHYFVVNRGGNRYIEFLAPDMTQNEESGDATTLRFLDCYTEKSEASPFSTITGLARFNGQEVETVVDGKPRGAVTVSGGTATLPVSGTKAYVGLPYTTEIRPTHHSFGLVGTKSANTLFYGRFYNSLGGEVSQDRTNWSIIKDLAYTNGDAVTLLSQDFVGTPFSTWQRKPGISLRQTAALPMTVLAMRTETKTSR